MYEEYIKELLKIYNDAKPVIVNKNKKGESIKKRRIFEEDSNTEEGDGYKKYLSVKKEIQELTEKFFCNIIPKELKVEYKLGLPINISQEPWICIYSKENDKATKPDSIYMGITLAIELVDIGNNKALFKEKAECSSIWIGQGISLIKKKDRISNRKNAFEKIRTILGDNLKNHFNYVISEKDDSGFIVSKDHCKVEDFEKDVQYLSKEYLKYTELDSKEVSEPGKNILVKEIENIDVIYDKYLNQVEEHNCSLIVFKPDYKWFITDLGIALKKAIDNKSEKQALIIKDIDKYPEEYMQELIVLLNRDKNGKTKHAISNSYLSNIIYGNAEEQVFIPRNLDVIVTTNKDLPKEIEELFQ